jgi:hypothetical protein
MRGKSADCHVEKQLSATEYRSRLAMFKRDLRHFIAVSGAQFMMFLTLTFRTHTGRERANDAFKRMLRFLRANGIKHWVKVLESTQKGEPHFHLLMLFQKNIAEGSDFDAVARYKDACEAASKAAPLPLAERREMRNATTRNAFLLQFWKWMDDELPRMGFGSEFDAFPVCHSGKTVTYMSKGAFPRVGTAGNAKAMGKKAQRFKFSRNCPRAPKLPPQGAWHLARAHALLAACGQQDTAYFKKHWGRQRGFNVNRVLSPRLAALHPKWQELPPQRLAHLIVVSLYSDIRFRGYLEPIIRDVFRTANPDAPFPNDDEHDEIKF